MQGRAALGMALAMLLGLLAVPAAASGATVSIQAGENPELLYDAGAGEENDLTITDNGASVTVEDPGADITVGANCNSISGSEASCALNSGNVNALLHGKGDRVRLEGESLFARFEGGPGADKLIGGAGPDWLDGGTGPDVIKGRGFSDLVRYFERGDDLAVTLGDGVRNDGGPNDGAQRDRLKGIEAALGGDGDDLLVGTGAENNLIGSAGADVLRGRGGEDTVNGGEGSDDAFGGGGEDLFPGDDGSDLAVGGRGPDTIQSGSPSNGADDYRGGKGADTMQLYAFGAFRVTLDGKANDGQCAGPGCGSSDEGDNVKGVEEILGALGSDVLIGSSRDETFSPAAGADTVRARRGDDRVGLFTDGDPDDVNCGGGADQIFGNPEAFDSNVNCEDGP